MKKLSSKFAHNLHKLFFSALPIGPKLAQITFFPARFLYNDFVSNSNTQNFKFKLNLNFSLTYYKLHLLFPSHQLWQSLWPQVHFLIFLLPPNFLGKWFCKVCSESYKALFKYLLFLDMHMRDNMNRYNYLRWVDWPVLFCENIDFDGIIISFDQLIAL